MYGNALGRQLPQQDTELVRRLSLRWLRAADPQMAWAKTARECVNFLEGEQWTPEQKAEMAKQGRPTLTINKINPLYRLVVGYQSNNRMDTRFLPQSDSQSTEDVAEVLNSLTKVESNRMGLNWVDTEVFSDGISTGRGYWDARLDFEKNDLGETKVVAKDPFSIYIDPDCNDYELKTASYIQESRWTSVDEIESCYGGEAAAIVRDQLAPSYQSALLPYFQQEEVTPLRFFGMYDGDKNLSWRDVYNMDFVDRYAKRLRLIDSQYIISSIKPCFVDLETGDFEAIPDDWLLPENQHKIEKCLAYAERVGNPMRVVKRPVKRVRWSVQCGDILIFDAWSPYESYTLIPFFPYFRRGKTRGMIEDMLDPQREINKKRSSIADILNRNANSGWLYHTEGLDPAQKENIRRFGSRPGINVEWKGNNASFKPERINPGGYPQGLDQLETKASNDLFQISGINESAMGQLDKVQSGRAIEARQRQAVLAIQMYQDNFSRSKKMQGEKFLELYQNHYTEPRMYRLLGEDGQLAQVAINQKAVTGTNGVERINDITVGKYSVSVDQVPMSASFKEAQFEEAMDILQKLGPVGQALVQTNPGLLVDMSSLPRKEEWKQSLQEALSASTGMASGSVPPPIDPATGQPMPGPVPQAPQQGPQPAPAFAQ